MLEQNDEDLFCFNSEPRDSCEILPEGYTQYDFKFKIIIIGNSGVGKTCLINRAFNNSYLTQPTIAIDYNLIVVRVKDFRIALHVWDTCGQEKFSSMISPFYRGSSIGVLVYSLVDRQSFEDLDIWLEQLKEKSTFAKVVLVGNKSDLESERVVSVEEAKLFQKKNSIDLRYESSAKNGDNVRSIFIDIARQLYYDFQAYEKKNFIRKKAGHGSPLSASLLHPFSNNLRLPAKFESKGKKSDLNKSGNKICSCAC